MKIEITETTKEMNKMFNPNFVEGRDKKIIAALESEVESEDGDLHVAILNFNGSMVGKQAPCFVSIDEKIYAIGKTFAAKDYLKENGFTFKSNFWVK